MEKSSRASVGVIGLGIIGSRVAASLRRSGHPVSVWNRSPRPEPNFLSSAREVAETCDFLQIFVTDGPALLQVIETMGSALGASHVVMNHATVSLVETMEAARMVREYGSAFLDAPFTGSRDAADRGEITYYVGGEETVLQRALPVLESSARAVLHLGPVGSATSVKIATNMISAAQVGALAEALALLDRSGVPLERLAEALPHNLANSGVIASKLPLMLSGDFTTRFSTANMLKDLQIALRSAHEAGIDLPVTASTAGVLMGAVQAGWGSEDFSSLARHYTYPGTVSSVMPHPAQVQREPSAHAPNPAVDPASLSAPKTPSSGGLLGFLNRRRPAKATPRLPGAE
jgi:3-hydroxyisobutyrate dehydrogenase-like beta-hydroxyacid dehydrogenase